MFSEHRFWCLARDSRWHNQSGIGYFAPMTSDRDNINEEDVIMIRTQISLHEDEYRAAKDEAARLGLSLAGLLRRALRVLLPIDQSKPWMRYAGMIETGDAESSVHIDDVVYGEKP
jgi:hypothetical protein